MNRRYRLKQKTALLLCLLMLAALAGPYLSQSAWADDASPGTTAGEADGSDPSGAPDAADDAAPADAAGAENAAASDWETRLLLMLQEHDADPATIAAGYYNFATGEEHYFHGDEYRVSGSMYKVPLNMLFMDWIAEGELTMDELIYGYRYSELLEGTIIHSDNDYARVLWEYAGATIPNEPGTLYHRYRILIAPLMGEDPNNVDDKYYENNFFTARQMITCLRQLYDGGSRYDRLIETMQRAEPNKYFKLHEQRFNIAHKYGWYAEDPVLYLNDCALCFTDDPIAIVLFTSGTGDIAYGVMADFCTLMCDYAQETHAERAAREEAEARAIEEAAQRDREEAAKRAEEETQLPASETASPQTAAPQSVIPTAKPAPEPVRRGLSAGPILALALVLGCSLAAIVWFSVRHRRGGLSLPYAIAAVVLTGAACMLCFSGVSGSGYVAPSDEDPAETVERFFRGLQEGDYEAAERCLEPGGSLGLSGALPADGTHAAALAALKDSWNCRLLGSAAVEKASAWQEVQLQVLDFSRMEQDLQRLTREQLLEMGASMPRSEMYDENGDYRPEAAGLAWDRALSVLLENPQEYYASVGLRIQLTLTRDGWKIVPTRELLSALSGNAG